jgi:hypothetical protein
MLLAGRRRNGDNARARQCVRWGMSPVGRGLALCPLLAALEDEVIVLSRYRAH